MVHYHKEPDCDSEAAVLLVLGTLAFIVLIIVLCLKCKSKKKPNDAVGEKEEMEEGETNELCDHLPIPSIDEISLHLQPKYSIDETDDMKIQSNKF